MVKYMVLELVLLVVPIIIRRNYGYFTFIFCRNDGQLKNIIISRLRANQITNENANGAPNFTHNRRCCCHSNNCSTNYVFNINIQGGYANLQGIDITGVAMEPVSKSEIQLLQIQQVLMLLVSLLQPLLVES